MPRVLCVWFPKWPIQRLRAGRPDLKRSDLALFAGTPERPQITVCSSKAEHAGVRTGQPLAEAKALLPQATFLQADFAQDRHALCQLALDCQRFTPNVGVEEGDGPESLFGELTGCAHLWGGEERFLQAVRTYWRRLGYRVHTAIAGSPGAAWALAHARADRVVEPGNEENAVSGLPVWALRLPTDVLERLLELGLTTIDDVLRLPRETLACRFGVILPKRLDQILGRLHETFVCERLREPLVSCREWEILVDDRFTLALLNRDLLEELVSKAGSLGMGLHELEGELKTEEGPVAIEIRLVEPTRDVGHLLQLVELQWERRKWPGGVVAARWRALKLGQTDHAQSFWPGDEHKAGAPREWSALVERLSSRLGETAVLRAVVVPDPQPEYAVRLIPWASAGPAQASRCRLTAAESRGRPFRLLGTPQPLEVTSLVPDGPPIRMVWQGRHARVVRSWGPERIATGWWRDRDVERDYYRALWTDGTQVWVYRDQRGRWFLHGYFD
jgi:protein ImuB